LHLIETAVVKHGPHAVFRTTYLQIHLTWAARKVDFAVVLPGGPLAFNADVTTSAAKEKQGVGHPVGGKSPIS